jgi:transcriptional regulator with XRE-family HTH domain
MSNTASTFVKGFILRLKEALGTEEPAEIARGLGISYQAAKNYLEGRLPSAEVLTVIAEQTDYSLNWLLTGQGAKKTAAENTAEDHTPGELELIIRRMVREEISRKKGAPAFEIGGKEITKRKNG